MTDSTPDDKNLTEDATTEETAQDAVDEPAAATGRAPRPRRPAAERAGAQAATAKATLTTVVITVVIIALLATAILFGVLWSMKKSELSDVRDAAADKAKAEKVALDYASGAATFDYRDLAPWRANLVKGVSPDLKNRLDATAGALNQLLQPLQWVSKATAMDAVVNSESGSVYKVNAYVRVQTTNVQAASGREVVTVYNVTLDKDKDWQITDVGGPVGDPASSGQVPAAPAPAASAPAESPAAPVAPAPTENPAAPVPAPGN
ncbi:hypothetical protein GCM10027289_23220 [Tsukamurella serpentis]